MISRYVLALALLLLTGCGGEPGATGTTGTTGTTGVAPAGPPSEADLKQALATTLGGKLVVVTKVGRPGEQQASSPFSGDNGPLSSVFLDRCQVAASLGALQLKAPPKQTRMGNWEIEFSAQQVLDEPLYLFDHGQRIDQAFRDVAQTLENSRSKAEPLPSAARERLDDVRKQLAQKWVATVATRKGATQKIDGRGTARWENGKWALDLESVLFRSFDPRFVPASKIPSDVVRVDLEDRATLTPWLAERQELARKVDFLVAAMEGKTGYAALWKTNLENMRTVQASLKGTFGDDDAGKVAAAFTAYAGAVRQAAQTLEKLGPPTRDDDEAYDGLFRESLEDHDGYVRREVEELQQKLPKYKPENRALLSAALEELRTAQQAYAAAVQAKLNAGSGKTPPPTSSPGGQR